jgi:dCMP deaminase
MEIEIERVAEHIVDIPPRPSWDEYFTEIVQVTAKRSPCKRLHVGCLFVRDHRIVSQGYNGFLPGCNHQSIVRDGHEQATVHAEQNCLADCAKRGVSSAGCIVYLTHCPCIICTRLLLASGIVEIRYLHDYKNDPLVAYFAEKTGVVLRPI